MKRIFVVPLLLVGMAFAAALAIARPSPIVRLDVPAVVRPTERSGPATLAMVLGFYGADSTVQKRTDEAFDARSREASLRDLAATAARLGYSARIAEPGIDSLATFLRAGVPPIVCVEPRRGIPGRNRYYVITRWDTLGSRFFGRDGSARTREMDTSVLQSVWTPGGGRALIVTRGRR